MSVDGRQVLTATTDDALGEGGVGAIDVEAGPDADDSEVVLDRFVVTPIG
jgi:hypothetical protein